jgi:hypothetical protein
MQTLAVSIFGAIITAVGVWIAMAQMMIARDRFEIDEFEAPVVAVLPHVVELRTQQIGSVTQRPDLCRQCGLGNLRAVLRCIALATRAFLHWG